MPDKVNKTDQQWKQVLSPEQFRIVRQKGTEAPFSGEYNDHKESGKYICVACGQELFLSENKYDSGSGWPSFDRPVAEQNIEETADHSLGMGRTEVTCSRCGGHLGHVFADGPKTTGQRYCINSAALKFKK